MRFSGLKPKADGHADLFCIPIDIVSDSLKQSFLGLNGPSKGEGGAHR